jgi:excinuclease UvrABC nuclease subunit
MTFNLATLPDVPYINPNREPRVAGVYFIISPEGDCLYIGQSSWIGHRVRNGPIRYLIPNITECRVRWIEVSNEDRRFALERLLLATHQPSFNKKYRRNLTGKEDAQIAALLAGREAA